MHATSLKVLVLGAGSVGRRHLKNLTDQGCIGSVFDPRQDRLEEARQSARVARASTSLGDFESATDDLDGVVVASPPSFHVDQLSWALERGLPVLMEKPLSMNLAGAAEADRLLSASNGRVLLGYTYRWWEPLAEFRRMLLARSLGKPIHVQCFMSAHLADWHPWEHYTEFFMASAALGGGALLDESHFIDLLLWMFGMPCRAFGKVGRLSPLQIETDDNVDAILDFPCGLRASVHLDLYGRPHEKWIRAVCEGGTIHWSFDPNEIGICSAASHDWHRRTYACVRNDMFVACAREFVAMMREGIGPSTCTVSDGMNVLRVIEAIRRSEASGRTEEV